MTHVITCDFCGEPIDVAGGPFAHLSITGSHLDGGHLVGVFRDYHAGERGDETTCLARALRLLDGGVRSELAAGWDRRTDVAELDLPARVVRVLRGAGVENVEQLADLRALGGLAGVRGIGARALSDIDAVLESARS